MPRLVILSGPPAAGKTTNAPKLAQALGMPMFSIDNAKERFADAIGPAALSFAEELGNAAIYHVAASAFELLASGEDVMIEGFIRHGPYEELLAPLITISDPVLLHFWAADLELKDRYEARALMPDRHWIHGDIARIGTLLPELPAELAAPLELGISRIFIDTTSGPLSLDEIVRVVNEAHSNAVVQDYISVVHAQA